MRRLLFTISALLFAATAVAQVEKQVEVTKQYVPKLPPARKMDMVPDMVDTVSIRPEIDYTIVPKSFASALTTEKFRPAKVTYWEYTKSYPFYIKAGVGYPLVSEVDAYASTNRADVGYFSAYVNHRGRFANIDTQNPITGEQFVGVNAQQMSNRFGITGGKYFGRYTLAGDIYYDSNSYRRYAQNIAEDDEQAVDAIDFEDVALAVNFGNSFADMSKLNFAFTLSADYYNDKSEQLVVGDIDRKIQQFDVVAALKLGRNIGQHARLYGAVEYQGYYGLKYAAGYSDNIISGAAAFEYDAIKAFKLKVGLKYSYDKVQPYKARHHILPSLYMGFNVAAKDVFVPYVEVDSRVDNNSYRALQQTNPYILLRNEQYDSTPNTATYNLRVGFAGHTLNKKFSYRLYANAAFIADALYWYNVENIGFSYLTDSQRVYSLNASLEYKPLSSLLLAAGAKGMIYGNPTDIECGKPSFEADFSIRYTHHKFAVGASADFIGRRSWTIVSPATEGTEAQVANYKYPMCVDFGLTFDWFVAKQCTIYLEGRNLGNAKIYDWALYRRLGIGALVGIKVQF